MSGRPNEWSPLGASTTWMQSLQAGMIVAFDHEVWRVISVADRPESDVTDGRDKVVVLRPINSTSDATAASEDRHLAASQFSDWRTYPDEHYPVCAQCNEPLPCQEQTISKEVDRSVAEMERYEIAGVCPACREPVTTRHLRQTWSENLITGSPEPVTIHLRRKCMDEAQKYDALWRKQGRVSQLGYQEDRR